MRVRGVGHACLEIEAAGTRIVTDPWWDGPAYTGQWFPWPAPDPAGLPGRQVDYVYVSHGHADHLHPPTLARLAPGAIALVPEFLSGGLEEYLRSLGFDDVMALAHGQTVTLRGGVRATCYLNLTDSILVLDDGRRVIVNGNDALHASPAAVIDHFCRLLARQHPSIDALFLGYGGASWFPNCIRLPGKDDVAQARRREELFVVNFLRVVDALAPRLACAFAASFVLVEPHNRWINEVKLDLPGPDRAHAARAQRGTRCHLLLPGDVVDGAEIASGGRPRPSRAELAQAFATSLRPACERVERLEPLSPAALDDLARRVDERVRRQRGRLGRAPALGIEVRLRDGPGAALRIRLDGARAEAAIAQAGEMPIALEMRSEILEAVLREDYGTESITIGYGALAHLQRPEQLGSVLALLRILSPRTGSWRAVVRGLRQRPLRTAIGVQRQLWPLAMHAATQLGLLAHHYGAAELVRG